MEIGSWVETKVLGFHAPPPPPDPTSLPGTGRPDRVTFCKPLLAQELALALRLGLFRVGSDGLEVNRDVGRGPEAGFQDFWGQRSLGESPCCRAGPLG